MRDIEAALEEFNAMENYDDFGDDEFDDDYDEPDDKSHHKKYN